MRFIPSNCIRENMRLGKSLFGKYGELLLRTGTVLNNRYISRINELGINGVYIEDILSDNIGYIEIINDKLRRDTIQVLKKTFIDIQKGEKNIQLHKEKLNMLAGNIVDEILEDKDVMINMIDIKVFDDYTFYHCVNVAILSIILGISLNLNRNDLYKLSLAALLHDIGKVFIPKNIISKPGKLTDEEYETIKTHARKGYEYLKNMFDVPSKSYIGILHHHEKYNGTGYPSGRKEKEISLFGRIISIADVYDALTSDRPYRKACLPSEAMEYIMGNSGSMFDPELTLLFTRKVAPYPIGTFVKLSDDRVGIVTENYLDCCMRPNIKIIKENDKNVEPYYLNLRDNKNVRNVIIKDIVNE